MNILTKTTNDQGQAFCSKKFETPGGHVENSYKCHQERFTLSDAWNLLKQRREFTKR